MNLRWRRWTHKTKSKDLRIKLHELKSRTETRGMVHLSCTYFKDKAISRNTSFQLVSKFWGSGKPEEVCNLCFILLQRCQMKEAKEKYTARRKQSYQECCLGFKGKKLFKMLNIKSYDKCNDKSLILFHWGSSIKICIIA